MKFKINKKAQITLFAILGLVIVTISAVIISVSRNQVQTKLDTELSSAILSQESDAKVIKDYFRTLFDLSALYGMTELGNGGGVIQNISGFDYSKLGLLNYNATTLFENDSVLFFLLDFSFNNKTKDNPWNTSAYPCFRRNLPYSCEFPTGYRTKPFYGDLNLFRNAYPVEEMTSLYVKNKIMESFDWEYANRSWHVPDVLNISVNTNFVTSTYLGVDHSYVYIVVDYNFDLIRRSNGDVFILEYLKLTCR